jgi:CDP-diacylglycerol--serine O-phosphatidyltransferase
MLSEIPIISLKFKNYKLSDNLPKVVLLAVSLLSALFLGWISVPVTFIAYIILSLFFKKSIQ